MTIKEIRVTDILGRQMMFTRVATVVEQNVLYPLEIRFLSDMRELIEKYKDHFVKEDQ